MTLNEIITRSVLMEDEPGNDPSGGNDPGGGKPGGNDPSGGNDPGGGDPAADDFRSQIPEDIRDDEVFSNINGVADLAKQLHHAQRLIGAKGVIKPAKDAPPEEWDKYYTAMGRPEKPDGYTIPTKDMPEGIELKSDDPAMAEFFKEAHRLGLSEQQVGGTLRFFAGYLKQTNDAHSADAKRRFEEAQSELRQRWGDAFDERLELAQNAIAHLGGQKLLDRLVETGLDNDPLLADAFSRVGKMIDDDEILGRGGNRRYTRTPEEAQKEVTRLRSDPEFMKRYESNDEETRQAAMAELDDLMKQAYPPEKNEGQ